MLRDIFYQKQSGQAFAIRTMQTPPKVSICYFKNFTSLIITLVVVVVLVVVAVAVAVAVVSSLLLNSFRAHYVETNVPY